MAKISTRDRNKDKFYKDGRKKSPNWEYRFDTAKIDGKRTTMSQAGFNTKREAEIAGTKAMAEYNNSGLSFEPTEISVHDYLQYWIDKYCLVNVSDSTLQAYRSIIKIHLNKRIGHYRLRSISTANLQECINDIYVQHGFTTSYMKNILKVIKGSFKYAYKTLKFIQENPAEDVKLPRIAKKDTENDDELIILSKKNVNRILERFEKSKYQYMAILTAYYTGLRVSEVYGLTWDNIDFEKKTVRVNKIAKKVSVETSSDGKKKRGVRGKALTKWYFGECKTKSSYRTVDIGDTLLTALKEYKEWQEANEKEYGEYYTRYYLHDELTETHKEVKRLIPVNGFEVEIPMERAYPVFIKENGEYHGTDSMKYPSKVINYELGIRFNFHALRHTHATTLIEAGVNVKVIAKRLGHSSTRTTLETYIHVTEKLKHDAVSKFEQEASLLGISKVTSIEEHKKKKKIG